MKNGKCFVRSVTRETWNKRTGRSRGFNKEFPGALYPEESMRYIYNKMKFTLLRAISIEIFKILNF